MKGNVVSTQRYILPVRVPFRKRSLLSILVMFAETRNTHIYISVVCGKPGVGNLRILTSFYFVVQSVEKLL